MKRGLALVEVLAVMLVGIMLLGFTVPMMTATTCDSLKNVSIRNLQALQIAHMLYAADWSPRWLAQQAVDDLVDAARR